MNNETSSTTGPMDTKQHHEDVKKTIPTMPAATQNKKQPAANLQHLIERLYQGKTIKHQVEQLLKERRLEAEKE